MTLIAPMKSSRRLPGILVFDLDNTLIAEDSTQLWLRFLYKAGVVADPRYREANDRMLRDYRAGTARHLPVREGDCSRSVAHSSLCEE